MIFSNIISNENKKTGLFATTALVAILAVGVAEIPESALSHNSEFQIKHAKFVAIRSNP